VAREEWRGNLAATRKGPAGMSALQKIGRCRPEGRRYQSRVSRDRDGEVNSPLQEEKSRQEADATKADAEGRKRLVGAKGL
jgi:hypothetical protein